MKLVIAVLLVLVAAVSAGSLKGAPAGPVDWPAKKRSVSIYDSPIIPKHIQDNQYLRRMCRKQHSVLCNHIVDA